jgi:hypothetical protein
LRELIRLKAIQEEMGYDQIECLPRWVPRKSVCVDKTYPGGTKAMISQPVLSQSKHSRTCVDTRNASFAEAMPALS